MLFKIVVGSRKSRLGTDEKLLLIAFLFQNLSQSRDTGKEGIVHVVVVVGQRNGKRNAAGLGHHGSHGPAAVGHLRHAVPAGFREISASFFPLELHQVRNQIFLLKTAVFRRRKGLLEGFQENIDEVSLFLRKSQLHSVGIHIMVLIEL